MPPLAFLCHGSEDNLIVERAARALMAAGVEVFFDKWEIRSGDSLRRKIDAGLGGCTHFLAFLTPTSIRKPWVNEEMDAAFVRKVEGQCRFIPLRMDLEVRDLPPLLQSIVSPRIAEPTFADDIAALVREIWAVSHKPPLGSPPTETVRPIEVSNRLSADAGRLIEYLIRNAPTASGADPVDASEIRRVMGLPDEEIAEAVFELESAYHIAVHKSLGNGPIGFTSLEVRPVAYLEYDKHWMGWNTESDAISVAALLVNSPGSSLSSAELAQKLGWTPRRLNPAICLLELSQVVESSKSIGSYPFITSAVRGKPGVRRFAQKGSPWH